MWEFLGLLAFFVFMLMMIEGENLIRAWRCKK